MTLLTQPITPLILTALEEMKPTHQIPQIKEDKEAMELTTLRTLIRIMARMMIIKTRVKTRITKTIKITALETMTKKRIMRVDASSRTLHQDLLTPQAMTLQTRLVPIAQVVQIRPIIALIRLILEATPLIHLITPHLIPQAVLFLRSCPQHF